MILLFSIFLIFIAGCGQTDFSNEELFEKEDSISESVVDGFHSITDGKF